MKEHVRGRVIVAVRVIVSVTLLAYLISTVDPEKLIEAWRGIIVPFLVLAVGLQIAGVAVSALKWWLLLRASDHHVPYLWAIRAYFIGQFFNNFLPTMIGGDAVRVYQLNTRIHRPATAIASVFVERLTGFLALVVIASVSLALSVQVLADTSQLLWAAVWCILIAGGALVVALFAAPIARLLTRIHLSNVLDWRGKLQSISQSLAGYYTHRRTFALAVVISFGYQFVWIASNYAVARSLGIDVPFTFMTLMVPVSDIIGLVPIFLNNLGAREGTFVVMLGQLGTSAALALSLAFLVFLVRLVVSLLGGVLYVFGGLAGPRRSLAEEMRAVQHARAAEKAQRVN